MKSAPSLRRRVFLSAALLSLSVIVVLVLLNLFFYDKYYLYTKKNELSRAYFQVYQHAQSQSEELLSTMDDIESSSAIRFGVLRADGTVLYTTAHAQPSADGTVFASSKETEYRSLAILSAIYRKVELQTADKTPRLLVVSLTEDERYLTLLGRLGGNLYTVAYMPYAILQQNAALNLTFLLIAGGVSLLLSLLLGFWLSRRLTRPLTQMAGVADRMGALDFSEKCTVNSGDEIGRLALSLNRLSSYLEQAIGDLQQTNARLSDEIAEKEKIDSLRRDFIINVSHELKTPIALIQGYAEGLSAGVAQTEDDRKFYCDTIVDEAGQLNHLVMQLLGLSKLELGRQEVEVEAVSLAALCHAQIQKSEVLIAGKQLRVSTEDLDYTVQTDAQLLEQVVGNYLSNAIRYTAEGGEIRIYTEKRGEKRCLCVYNSGEGLPENELSLIWEKFYRTDSARSRESGGSGIGLSLVRAIADTLHTECGAENAAGGIVFWIILDFV